ncbi:MAG: hypothetical protein RIR76_84 [Verrucomicrobiota bacterium]|jgi:hypothetical protein
MARTAPGGEILNNQRPDPLWMGSGRLVFFRELRSRWPWIGELRKGLIQRSLLCRNGIKRGAGELAVDNLNAQRPDPFGG